MSSEDEAELKKAINQFIWENAPAEMTLEDAEAAAVALFDAFMASVPPQVDMNVVAAPIHT